MVITLNWSGFGPTSYLPAPFACTGGERPAHLLPAGSRAGEGEQRFLSPGHPAALACMMLRAGEEAELAAGVLQELLLPQWDTGALRGLREMIPSKPEGAGGLDTLSL